MWSKPPEETYQKNKQKTHSLIFCANPEFPLWLSIQGLQTSLLNCINTSKWVLVSHTEVCSPSTPTITTSAQGNPKLLLFWMMQWCALYLHKNSHNSHNRLQQQQFCQCNFTYRELLLAQNRGHTSRYPHFPSCYKLQQHHNYNLKHL